MRRLIQTVRLNYNGYGYLFRFTEELLLLLNKEC
jgi:hypothetical protein